MVLNKWVRTNTSNNHSKVVQAKYENLYLSQHWIFGRKKNLAKGRDLLCILKWLTSEWMKNHSQFKNKKKQYLTLQFFIQVLKEFWHTCNFSMGHLCGNWITILSKVPEEMHQMTLSCSPPLGVSGLECVHHSDVYQGRALEVTVKSSNLLKSSKTHHFLSSFFSASLRYLSIPTPHPFQTSFPPLLTALHFSVISNSNDFLTPDTKHSFH